MSKVSFIIPCYNIEDYISFCLDSVINQSYKDIEIICINDGSTDKTEEILRTYQKFDSRIKVLNKENGGQSTARNLGLEHVTGKYLHFLDGDDFISPILAEITVGLAEQFDTDMVCFNNLNLNMKTWVTTAPFMSLKDKGVQNKLILKEEMSDNDYLRAGTTTCYRLYKTDFIQKSGLKFLEGMVYEDAPFSAEALCRANRFAFSNLPLYTYRVVRDGSTMTSSAGMRFKDCFKSLEIRDFILKKFGMYERLKGIFLHLDISFLFLTFNRLEEGYRSDYYNMMQDYFRTLDFSMFPKYCEEYKEQYDYVQQILESKCEV